MGATLSIQARDGTRTHDLFLTKEVLCRLSYASTRPAGRSHCLHTARGIRTPVTAVRGRRPGPLDDSGATSCLFPEQGRRESNPQPPVLETGALPIELLPYGPRLQGGQGGSRTPDTTIFSRVLYQLSYLALLPQQKAARRRRGSGNSGGGIRTRDLRVMSPTSYQAAPPRVKDEQSNARGPSSQLPAAAPSPPPRCPAPRAEPFAGHDYIRTPPACEPPRRNPVSIPRQTALPCPPR